MIARMLNLISVIMLISATLMGFFYPGTEQTLGAVQRLFYIHLGTFYGALLAFGLAVIGGIAYLRTHHQHWDALSLAGIEIGAWLSTITIVTGMCIARPVWGRFWVWDARLTAIAIMWLTYMAYFFLRQAFDTLDTRRRFAAVYSILAFTSVILSMIMLRIGNNMTTPALTNAGMSARITQTILFNILAYSIFALVLVYYRQQLATRQEQLMQRRLRLWE